MKKPWWDAMGRSRQWGEEAVYFVDAVNNHHQNNMVALSPPNKHIPSPSPPLSNSRLAVSGLNGDYCGCVVGTL